MIDLDSLRKKHNALIDRLYELARGSSRWEPVLALVDADSFTSVLLRELTQEHEANSEAEAIIHALVDDRFWWRQRCRNIEMELCSMHTKRQELPVVPLGGVVFFDGLLGWTLRKDSLRSPADLAQAYRCLAWAIENNTRPPHADDNRQEPEAPAPTQPESKPAACRGCRNAKWDFCGARDRDLTACLGTLQPGDRCPIGRTSGTREKVAAGQAPQPEAPAVDKAEVSKALEERALKAEARAVRERLRSESHQGDLARLLMAMGLMSIKQHGIRDAGEIETTFGGVPCTIERVVFDRSQPDFHKVTVYMDVTVDGSKTKLYAPFEGLEFQMKAPQ